MVLVSAIAIVLGGSVAQAGMGRCIARRKPPVIPDQLLDELLSGADAKTAFEKDGLMDELKKALAERALNAEIDRYL